MYTYRYKYIDIYMHTDVLKIINRNFLYNYECHNYLGLFFFAPPFQNVLLNPLVGVIILITQVPTVYKGFEAVLRGGSYGRGNHVYVRLTVRTTTFIHLFT